MKFYQLRKTNGGYIALFGKNPINGKVIHAANLNSPYLTHRSYGIDQTTLKFQPKGDITKVIEDKLKQNFFNEQSPTLTKKRLAIIMTELKMQLPGWLISYKPQAKTKQPKRVRENETEMV